MTADEIVRALADSSPTVTEYDGTDGRNYCTLCVSDGGRPRVYHEPYCPWKLAVEYVAANPVEPATSEEPK